jgi:hypothetical protein
MSKMLLAAGGYRDPRRAMLYTDTDSLVLNTQALSTLPACWINDKQLGLFKDDLKGRGKILRFVALAPKVYALLFMTDDEKLWVKIRCKGIPHDNDPVEVTHAQDALAPHDPVLAQQAEAIIHYRDGHDAAKAPLVDLRFRAYYVRFNTDEAPVVSNHLCIKAFEMLLDNKVASISCLYGSLKIHYGGGHYGGGGFSVQPRFELRQLADNLEHHWWNKGQRLWREDLQFTVPQGFI